MGVFCVYVMFVYIHVYLCYVHAEHACTYMYVVETHIQAYVGNAENLSIYTHSLKYISVYANKCENTHMQNTAAA
jgi:hypothetical protein